MSAAPSSGRRTQLEGMRRVLRSPGVPFAEWTSDAGSSCCSIASLTISQTPARCSSGCMTRMP